MLFWTAYYSFPASNLQFQPAFSKVSIETKERNKTKKPTKKPQKQNEKQNTKKKKKRGSYNPVCLLRK